MIRLRSQKLLAGVSTLAVLAALGCADPSLAGQTITSAGNPNPPVTNAVSDDFIDINTNAVVTADGSGNSVTNSGTLTSYLSISASHLLGNVFNSGTITGTGVDITNFSLIDGVVNNTGTIDALGDGLFIDNSFLSGGISNGVGALISGSSGNGITISGASVVDGITNDGTISGGNSIAAGISLSNTVVLTSGITNSATGTISAGGLTAATGLRLGMAALLGDVDNSGTIQGGAFGFGSGIVLSNGIVNGSIINRTGATISGSALFTAVGLLLSGGTLAGNVDNSGTISAGAGGVANGILLNGSTVTGSIINRAGGVISAGAGTTAAGINLTSGTLIGDIDNSGAISGSDFGITLSGATVAGQILNRAGGTISATTASGVAISMTGGTLAQGIDNQGSVLADVSNGVAISITGGTFQNGITNSGLVSATGTSGQAIIIGSTTFNGGINNTSTGTIQASSTAVGIFLATFNGGLLNDGTIVSNNGTAVSVGLANFTGDFENNGSVTGATYGLNMGLVIFTGDINNNADGTITGGTAGIFLNTVTVVGDLSNAGIIQGGSNALRIVGSTIGDISNSGTMQTTGFGPSAHAVTISGASTVNSFTNDGTIAAEDDGVNIAGSTITNDFVNNDTITGATSGTGVGVNINSASTIGGIFSNSGTISGATALLITGNSVVTGGVENSGDILGGNVAIDISGATTAPLTITQTAGTIQGPTALNLLNGQDDIFLGQGGVVDGDILADGFDDFSQNGSGTFAYSSGTATGIYHFDIDGTGTFLIGTDTRGVDGTGANVTADHMSFNDAGRAYLDDNTLITLTNGFSGTTGGTLEYFLTTATGTHGQIAASTVTLDGTIAAFLDPVTFAAAALPTTATLTYDNVLTGAVSGTFTNVGDILVTSSPFFTGTVIYNANDVDIQIQRLALNSALIVSTQNQASVAGALETIYLAGGLSPDLTDMFSDLFGASTTAEAQGLLNELSGSQFAQVQQATVSVGNNFTTMVEERLDGILVSEDDTRMSALGPQRYAQAIGVSASDAMGSGGTGSQGLTRGPSGVSVWLRGLGDWVNVDADPEASGYDQKSNGLVGGVDYALNSNATIGGAAAYTQTDVDFDTAPDNAELDSWQVGAYGSYGLGRLYLDGQASYASHDVSTLRMIDLGAAAGSTIATAGYNASAWSVKGELGTIWRLGRVNMQPSVALAYTGANADGFTESGPGYALIVAGADSDSLASTLALRAAGVWTMGKTRVVPDIKLGWRHEFDDSRQSFSAMFIDDALVPFTIVSSEIQADSLIVSTGLTAGVTRNVEVFFDMNGQYNADASATNASGGVRVTW